MKIISGIFKIFTLVSAICFFLIGCQNNNNDPRPKKPEPMSTKTAMQYFKDEGINIGINLGNTLDAVDNWTRKDKPVAVEGAWGAGRATQEHFNGLAALGFKIVRIPCTWVGHIGPAPDYKIDEARLRRVAEVIGYAKNAGLKAFINLHHDGNSGQNMGGWLDISKAVDGDTSISDKYEKVWKQIAEYFINYGDWLMFQGFNEIHDGSWKYTGTQEEYNVINTWNQKFTDAVRSTGGNNAKRYLLYYGYMTSHEIALADYSKFILPADNIGGSGRQIIGFHYYQPEFAIRSITHEWDNMNARKNIDTVFSAFKKNFIDKGIPVIIGENGPLRYNDFIDKTGASFNPNFKPENVPAAKQNRLLYIDYMYGRARENSLIPFFWENGNFDEAFNEGDACLFDRKTGKPNSDESAEVIRHMFGAINGTIPIPPPNPNASFSSWTVYSAEGSRITYTSTSGRNRIQGTVGEGSWANVNAAPNDAMLEELKTMRALSFMTNGNEKQYAVIFVTPETIESGYNHYRYTFTAAGSESRITVNIPGGIRQYWGKPVPFIQENIQYIQFQLADTGDFDLTVWDIRVHQ
ncbi:MAG: glycoside hydrolase family 5 protein [Treponema sp.]|jgi:endoglucanase|nr:glycoside hydrolase family 5 protein [Treponema sp.]